MRLSKSRLRRIIREEASKLDEGQENQAALNFSLRKISRMFTMYEPYVIAEIIDNTFSQRETDQIVSMLDDLADVFSQIN